LNRRRGKKRRKTPRKRGALESVKKLLRDKNCRDLIIEIIKLIVQAAKR
jgi:hypothetical protein